MGSKQFHWCYTAIRSIYAATVDSAMDAKKTATLTLGIEPVLREALKNAALGERCSLANMDEVMIQDYSKNHGHALPDAAEELKPGNRSE